MTDLTVAHVTDTTPVIVGVGRCVRRTDDTQPAQWMPLDILAEAGRLALQDADAARPLTPAIDLVAAVRFYADSVDERYARRAHPFGTTNNVPRSVARRLGIEPAHAIYGAPGGQSPQRMVNEIAARIAAGECQAALLVGGEATTSVRSLQRAGAQLDWHEEVAGSLDDRGYSTDLFVPYEVAHGVTLPLQAYPLLEQALRARTGADQATHRQRMARLFAGFAEVAQRNPYAAFPVARDAAFLETPSQSNYLLSDAYTRWLVAQDGVDQAAAVLMMSAGHARALGIDPGRWVFLHGCGDADDLPMAQRPELGMSRSMQAAAAQALQQAGRHADEMTLLDLYSCFPVAVFAGCEALGLDWEHPPVPLTVTGGLPFFGGAGNAYSLCAIAEMVARLRQSAGAFGLVLANGGYLSKHSVGIYSTTPPRSGLAYSAPVDQLEGALQAVPVAPDYVGPARIESHVVVYKQGQPSFAYIAARNPAGERVLAKVASDDLATVTLLLEQDPLDRPVLIEKREGKQYFRLLDAQGRTLPLRREFPPSPQDCSYERRGQVLVVRLERAELRNALTPHSHRELAGIFRAFEDDPDLRVAIITGRGDAAFCSGNDLKFAAGAKGRDMLLPPEGFGGLTSFVTRRKPVIAAVNGLAFGGGFEIALASDLVVAARHARFALPEPKVGLAALAGGIHRLARQLPNKRAMGLLLTGADIDAETACEWGLVNEVCEPAVLLDQALQWADRILACSPVSIDTTLRGVREGLDAPTLADALALDTGYGMKLIKSRDFKEGVQAFVEKRKPVWTGR